MNRISWAALVTTGLLSLGTLAGCSDEPASPGSGGTSSTGGTAATGGTSAGGTGTTGTKLDPPVSYTILSGADAAAAPAAAPAAYSGPMTACLTCHGQNGEGVTLLAPEIRHIQPTYATWVVRNGRGFMSKFDTTALSDADLQAILTWLSTPPKPTTGEGLYKDFCGNCHGPTTPSGGAVPVNVRGLSAAVVSTYVRNGYGSNPADRNEYMPPFPATVLTDAELALIQTHLGSTTP